MTPANHASDRLCPARIRPPLPSKIGTARRLLSLSAALAIASVLQQPAAICPLAYPELCVVTALFAHRSLGLRVLAHAQPSTPTQITGELRITPILTTRRRTTTRTANSYQPRLSHHQKINKHGVSTPAPKFGNPRGGRSFGRIRTDALSPPVPNPPPFPSVASSSPMVSSTPS